MGGLGGLPGEIICGLWVLRKVENRRPTQFVSQLLKDVLNLSEAPLLDRAHRSPRPEPQPEDPRVCLSCVCTTHMRDEIVPTLLQGPRCRGKTLHIYPDYTTAVMRKRAPFGDVNKKLRSTDEANTLRFPATLHVPLLGNKERTFEDPALTMDFINSETHNTNPRTRHNPHPLPQT